MENKEETKLTSFYLPRDTIRQLKIMAAEQETSMVALIREAVDQMLHSSAFQAEICEKCGQPIKEDEDFIADFGGKVWHVGCKKVKNR